MISRRCFLGGALALAAGCRVVRPFARFTASRERLRFGVLSDLHLRTDNPTYDGDHLKKALEFFRDNGADAVLVAGDIADGGRIAELWYFADIWRSVFPNDTAPDGRHVEKLFVYGNHDVDGGHRQWRGKDPATLDPSLFETYIGITEEQRAKVWEQVFGEKYEPIWIKEVKGYRFVGAHWYAWLDGRLDAFLQQHAAELSGPKPFFYTQHAHPKNTCMGPWAWGGEGHGCTEALAKFPNAVVFSGHSHYPLTDERSIWQGAFTSVNTGSMRYASMDYNMHDTVNFGDNGWGYKGWPRERVSPKLNTFDARWGMLVDVCEDEIVFHRREFVAGESLPEDWVVPIDDDQPYTFAEHARKRSAPAFDKEQSLSFSFADDEKKGRMLQLSIPPAHAVDGSRVFDYEVTVSCLADDVDLQVAQKRVIAADFHLATRQNRPTIAAFKIADLPAGVPLTFAVRPVECFGQKGRPIMASYRLKP